MEDLDRLILTLKETKTIPHLLFYGEPHSGKRKKVQSFLRQIYTPEEYKQYCMKIECATSNGIKMIRDVIKEFAKQQIGTHVYFKSIVLYDAENLTIDAQYSLRRCIEVYSKTTRFFIVALRCMQRKYSFFSKKCEIKRVKNLLNDPPESEIRRYRKHKMRISRMFL